jgi:hypothetical protein
MGGEILYTVYKREICVKEKSGFYRRESFDFIRNIIGEIALRKNVVLR